MSNSKQSQGQASLKLVDRVYWGLQLVNATLTMTYLIAHLCLLGVDFVCRDSAKYLTHVVALPCVWWCLREAARAIIASGHVAWPKHVLRRAALAVSLSAVVGFVVAFGLSIYTFNNPSIDSATYPTDYWYSISGVMTLDGHSAYDIALDGWRKHDRSAMAYKIFLTDSGDLRAATFFWDVGPLGVVGPMLTSLGFMAPGVLLTMVWLLIVGATKGYDSSGGLMFKCLLACGLVLTPFPGVNTLSVQAIWFQSNMTTAPAGAKSSAILLVLYAALFVVAWSYVRKASWARRLAAFGLLLCSVAGPIVRISKPEWLPTLDPGTVLLTTGSVYMLACAFVWVAFNPPPPQAPAK